MLRERQKLLDRISITSSGVLIFISFYFWFWIIRKTSHRFGTFNEYFGIVIVFIVIVIFGMVIRGVSASKRAISIADILKEIFICYTFGALGLGLFTYIFKIPHFSRLYLLSSLGISYCLISIFYILNLLVYREIRIRGLNYRNVLLVGNKDTLPEFINTIKNNKALGLNIIGIMTIQELDKKDFMGYKYFSTVDHIKKVLNSEVIDYAVFAVYAENPQAVEKAIFACQERGIEVWLKPDFMEKIMLSQVDYLEEIPLFIFSLSSKNEFALTVKRIFDAVASFLLIIILGLPMLIIAFLVRKTTKGPALFKQKRIGLNGRKFIMYKFRTMYTDLQQRRSEYKLKNEMKGPVFKMKKDPRITPIGYFLRQYSLDELPQLFNVLNGDMSLVGPRPPLPSEVYLYKGWQRRRLSMRPGITCIWQVSGRNKINDFDEWVKLDLKYIDTWSLWLDFKILFTTIPTVLKGTGY